MPNVRGTPIDAATQHQLAYTVKGVPQEDLAMIVTHLTPPVSDDVLAFWHCQAQWLRAANDAIADFYG